MMRSDEMKGSSLAYLFCQVPEPVGEPSKSSSSSSASTRVSEFRSKFEKFGGKSRRSDSVDEQLQQRHKSEMDAHQVLIAALAPHAAIPRAVLWGGGKGDMQVIRNKYANL